MVAAAAMEAVAGVTTIPLSEAEPHHRLILDAAAAGEK